MKIFRGKFFHFFKIFIFWDVERVKGQKKAQNGKKFCPSQSIYQELYIIWLWFLVNMCKLMISHFFKILIFRAFRGVKVQKMTHNYQFLSITLYIFGTVDHIIRFLVHKCKIIIFPVVFLCLFNKPQRFLLAHFNRFFNSCFLSSSIYPNEGILSCGPPSSHVCDFSLQPSLNIGTIESGKYKLPVFIFHRTYFWAESCRIMIDWDLPLGEKIWLSGGLASEADTLCYAKGLWTYYQYFMD